MAFMQYLKMEGVSLPLPDSYDLNLTDVEADSGGETEAGTTQRDVVRTGVLCQRRMARKADGVFQAGEDCRPVF